MAMPQYLIGQPGIFNPDSETYSERVAYRYLFQAKRVAKGRKKAMLISLMTPKAYKLLQSWIAPLKPDGKSYADLVRVMENTMTPFHHRYKFNNRVKKTEDSVSIYLSQHIVTIIINYEEWKCQPTKSVSEQNQSLL